MSDVKFEIEIGADAGPVERLGAALTTATSTVQSAAAAAAQAEAKYSELETAADKAAKAFESVTLKAAANREAMAAAMAAGDDKKFWKLAGAATALAEQEAKLGAAAESAASDLRVQAAAVDALTGATLQAKAAQASLNDEIKAQKLRDEETAADKAAAAMLRKNEATYAAAEAERKLSDQLKAAKGKLSDEARASENAKKAAEKEAKGRTFALKESQKDAKLLVGIAGVVLAGFIAAGAGVYSLVSATVAFADKEKRLDKASAQLSKNLAKTFGGLKISKLLDGMDTLVALFDSSTASGRALKFLFEKLFQPLVDGVAGAIPFVERLFLHAEILALKAYIALKPYSAEIATVAKWFGIAAAIIGGVVVTSLAIFIGFIAGGIAVIVGIIAAIAALIGYLYNLLPSWDAVKSGATAAWGAVTSAISSAIDFLRAISLYDVGVAMIEGLVSGIIAVGGKVLSAITGAVSSAIQGAKDLLGISSPSKVFAEIGQQTSAGMTGGIEAGAGDTQDAMSALVEPPAAGAPGAGGGSKTSVSISIANLNVGGAGAKEQAMSFLDELTAQLEGLQIQVGG